ncbi:MAG: cysteine desulfurase family protein [Pseudomonadota bacterium]
MTLKTRSYLDYNASAPLLECARDAIVDAYDRFGNASSVHFEGRAAKKTVEDARSTIADFLDANPANMIFTSGATEAANHILSPKLRISGKQIRLDKLYVGATEHPCITQGGRFLADNIKTLAVNELGLIDLNALEQRLQANHNADNPALVAVQLANSETGVIQPISRISDIVHAYDCFLLVDAVQGIGKIPFNIKELQADFVIVSGHKIGGPQGIGALILANGNVSPEPLFKGGGQENYHRGGTENVAAITGFAAACNWHKEYLTENIQNFSLRDSIEEGISTISLETGNGVPQPVFFGKSASRLGNTSCFAVSGIKSETALMSLDLDGVSVSSGSACSSGKVKQSHVLEAMGATPEEMAGALRVSIGWETDLEDSRRFLTAWKTIVSRMAA